MALNIHTYDSTAYPNLQENIALAIFNELNYVNSLAYVSSVNYNESINEFKIVSDAPWTVGQESTVDGIIDTYLGTYIPGEPGDNEEPVPPTPSTISDEVITTDQENQFVKTSDLVAAGLTTETLVSDTALNSTHRQDSNNPHSTTVANLDDTTITNPEENDHFVYISGEWVNKPLGATGPFPMLQVSRNSIISATSWTDIQWTSLDVETDATVIERDDTNTDRIVFKETGFYKIFFKVEGRVSGAGRLRYNDTTTVSGSETDIIGMIGGSGLDSSEARGSASGELLVEILSPNDWITLQAYSGNLNGDGDDLNKFLLTAIKMEQQPGAAGDTGPAGADGTDGAPGSGSTINASNNGVLVPNSPFDKLNFSGSGYSVTDGGGGTLDINIQGDEGFIVADRHNGVTTQSFTGSPITFLFPNVIREDSHFSYSNGEITFNNSGWYEVHFNIAYDQTSGNSRSAVEGYLEVDYGIGFVPLPGVRSFGYSRQITVGLGTLVGHALYEATVGDVLRVRAYVIVGGATISTVIEGSRLTIEYEGT